MGKERFAGGFLPRQRLRRHAPLPVPASDCSLPARPSMVFGTRMQNDGGGISSSNVVQ